MPLIWGFCFRLSDFELQRFAASGPEDGLFVFLRALAIEGEQFFQIICHNVFSKESKRKKASTIRQLIPGWIREKGSMINMNQKNMRDRHLKKAVSCLLMMMGCLLVSTLAGLVFFRMGLSDSTIILIYIRSCGMYKNDRWGSLWAHRLIFCCFTV